jgi:hypothetical protein
VVGLGRGLIDRFFPRMKEDFSNILPRPLHPEATRYNSGRQKVRCSEEAGEIPTRQWLSTREGQPGGRCGLVRAIWAL